MLPTLKENIDYFQSKLENTKCLLVAVSKTYPTNDILEAYKLGLRNFGENKVQELCEKYTQLPNDINWHLIGHLQKNKVKYIAPFIHLIHSVDSFELLNEINKQGKKNNRIINCLLQIYIAQEETKFGFDINELITGFDQITNRAYPFTNVVGIMGMASNTNDKDQIRKEFQKLKNTFNIINSQFAPYQLKEISMGMSNDFELAIEEGSTMIRVGSAIFGKRK